MGKIFALLIFLISLVISFTPYAYAIDDLTTVCKDGKYDYCSQAPKCDGYPEWNEAWERRSRELWDRYEYVFQFCQYKICEGYVPLCCYEMVRTGDKDKCAGYDTLYCLPKQCAQVPDSGSKQCAHGARGNFGDQCDIENLNPLPLSQRFPNDVLFILIDANLNSPIVQSLPTRFPEIWQDYLAWKNSHPTNTPTPSPTTGPTSTPTPSPTPGPSATGSPSMTPTTTPSIQPSFTPTPSPTPVLPTLTTSPNCPKKNQGDANCNNAIDEIDYEIWKCFFAGKGHCNGPYNDFDPDFNRDRQINLIDFEIWRRNYYH